jgi:hypothetical protein
MSMGQQTRRLEVFVDIFDFKNQQALALPNLKPSELVESILEKFGSKLLYLSNKPDQYELVHADKHEPLSASVPLEPQLLSSNRLILVEREEHLPPGTHRPTHHLYLREQTTAEVYKLHWQPAVIGRHDSSKAHDERVAVDLTASSNGLRVSRRHVEITEENGQYYIKTLASNQVSLKRKDTQEHTVLEQAKLYPLYHGDTISLDYSQIALMFLVRDKEATP